MARGRQNFFKAELHESPLLAIFRDLAPATAVRRAEALWEAGVRLVEVSLAGAQAFETLEDLVRRGAEQGRVVGVGTVLTTRELESAVSAGAAFAVSPGLDEEVARAASTMGLPFLPGVATASEIQEAIKLGCRVLKMFPASQLGAEWIVAMKGPFPSVRFVPTGGVTSSNALDFMRAGALAVAMGSSLSESDIPNMLLNMRSIRNAARPSL